MWRGGNEDERLIGKTDQERQAAVADDRVEESGYGLSAASASAPLETREALETGCFGYLQNHFPWNGPQTSPPLPLL